MSELNKDLNLAAQPTGSVARSNYTLNTVAISDVKPENLDSILLNKIDPQREVFYGSPLVLDISNRASLLKLLKSKYLLKYPYRMK